MAFPTFIIGPGLNVLLAARRLHQRRRKVKLTVHQAYAMTGGFAFGDGPAVTFGQENYYVTVTNASRDRDITVTHVWFDTEPRVDIVDGDLPVRLRYSEPWETAVSIETVPAEPPEAFWLARCLLAPDDKVVKSRPRKNVPPFGRVPRGGSVS